MELKFSPEHMIDAIPADITAIDAAGNTYVGRFDRSKVAAGSDVEAQPVWMIKKIELIESGSETVYRTTFPNGVKSFTNVWNDRATLTYTFNKN